MSRRQEEAAVRKALTLVTVIVFAPACDHSSLGGVGGEGGAGGRAAPCSADQRLDALGNCLETCINQRSCPEATECHLGTGLCLPLPECDPESCQAGWMCPT